MAVLSLLVPPMLSRYLPQAQFRVWMLLIQLATFFGLLNLGLQSAISRYVAHYLAVNDRDSASNLVSTAFLMLVITALVATFAVFALSSNLAGLFPALPELLADTAKTCLLVMGITSALGIPIEAISGTIVGIQRNDAAAAIQGTGRLTLAAALVTIVLMRGGITAMAAAFAVSNVASYLGLWLVYRHFDVVDISYRRMNRDSLRQIWDYSGTLAVWMVAMFFINGFDVALVGRLDFPAVGVYSACFGPILVIAGTQHAVFSPLLQFGAVRSSRGSEDSLPPLLLRTTRLSTLVLMLMSVPLLLFSRNLLAWWLGPAYSDQTLAIFRLLLVGNTTRLLGTPYAMLLLATLRHRQVLLSPILEAASNVLIAVLAGLRFAARSGL